MSTVTVVVQGKRQVRAKLDGARRRMLSVAERKLVLAGKLLERAWKSRIGPGRALGTSDPNRLTGEMRDSINTVLFAGRSKAKRASSTILGRTRLGVVIVGPAKPKGNLMGIHERGMSIARTSTRGLGHVADYRPQPVVDDVTRAEESRVGRLVAEALDALPNIV